MLWAWPRILSEDSFNVTIFLLLPALRGSVILTGRLGHFTFPNFFLPLMVIISRPPFRRTLRVFHLAAVWDYVFSVGSDTPLMGMLPMGG
jgi:hypothetical protein